MRKLFYLSSIALLFASCSGEKQPVNIVMGDKPSVRAEFGAEHLSKTLQANGYQVTINSIEPESKKFYLIVIGELDSEFVQLQASQLGIAIDKQPGKEGFTVKSGKNAMLIGGADASGTLYGCVEIANRVKRNGKLPHNINMVDQPEMALRGVCVGVQKPYTPETFSWFYNKQLWIKYLDMLVDNRMNSLYLWTPEVDEAAFKNDEEMFGFLTAEANKRGVAVIQHDSVHISNVHILANLEPFRYGSPELIRKTVIALHEKRGDNELHLYPQASYRDLPYSADNTNPRLLQVERDWILYSAWARYAWSSKLEPRSEAKFWTKELGDIYGCGKYGLKIKEAYDESGEIAPKLLRCFGITDGSCQTLLPGMFMAQLLRKEPKTSMQLIDEAAAHSKRTVKAIDKAAKHVTKNKEEFSRLRNDMYCYSAFANFFAQKMKAAALVLRYQHSNNIADLNAALPYLEKSVEHWRKLVELTNETYLYAGSTQTHSIGDNGKNKTWAEMLPLYERELDSFKRNLTMLKNPKSLQMQDSIAQHDADFGDEQE
jgi:hypothetical protein